jgi:hypothetical protein
MSLELLQWLNDKLLLQEAIEANHDNTVSTRLRAFRDPKVHDWNDRCLLAAERGYRPAFSNYKGELTTEGHQKAEIIRNMLMDATLWQRDHPTQFEGYDPTHKLTIDELPIARLTEREFWTKADHCFLSMEITKRQYSMLQMLDRAMKEAEQTNRQELDAKYKSAKTAQMLEELDELGESASSREELIRLDALRATGTASSVSAEQAGITTSQSFQAIMLKDYQRSHLPIGEQVQLMQTPDLSQPAPVYHAYVPTAMFGQRARNDLNNLVKYGLVHLKSWSTGVRGRPRHIVRVSEVGHILLNDPELQQEMLVVPQPQQPRGRLAQPETYFQSN